MKLLLNFQSSLQVLFFCISLLLSPGDVYAQLINNGDFSQGFLNCQGPAGWRSNNNVQVANVYQPGDNWVDITGCVSGNGNWIEQDVKVTPGRIYVMKMDLGSWFGWDDEDAGVFVYVNGVQLGKRYFNDSFTGSLQMKLFWKTVHTCAFIPLTQTITIRITGHGLCTKNSPQRACDNPYPGVIGLDNVVLEEVQIQTPEKFCMVNGYADLSYIYTGIPAKCSVRWKKDGVPVSDDSVFRTNVPGTYTLEADFECAVYTRTITVGESEVHISPVNVCGGSIEINGKRIISDTEIRDTFVAGGGCDSIVRYLVRFKKKADSYPDRRYYFCENGIDSVLLEGGPAQKHQWIPGGQETRNRYASSAGTYLVVMTDSMGCKDTARAELVSSCVPRAYIPSAFSPDGDGKNDVLFPVIPGAESFRLLVFNRWGEMLYDSDQTNKGWDGYYKNILCQQSSYLYLLSFVVRSSKVSYNLSGTFTLLR